MTANIARYIDDIGGVATAAQLKDAGFAPGTIEYAFKHGAIDKLTRGVYCTPDVFDDDFAAVTKRWPKCILSHGTALYLLGLSDRVPGSLSVSVPYGYNPHGLRTAYPDLRVHREKPELHGLGAIEVKDPMGILVSAYGAERSIADLLREREKGSANPQLIRDAMLGYFKRNDRDLAELARMCEALGVRDEMQRYLEVLS